MFEEKIIRDGNMFVKGKFNKTFENDEYEVHFNTENGLEVLKGKHGADPFQTELPLLIDVGIMGRCLNKCPFCYQGTKEESHMSIDDFKFLIDQVKHHTNQVALGGRGDPNLHPNFREIVTYARENNVVPNYTTSGINLTSEQVEISKMCGAVAVSDYGMPFTFSALNNLMENKIKTNIHLIFSSGNFDKAMKIINGEDPWNGKVNLDKLNAVVFLLFKPQGSGKNVKDMIPSAQQIKDFSALAFKPKAKFKVGMDSCLINHVLNFSQPNRIQRMAIDTCESSRMSVYVTPSLKLIPCSFADHDEWGIKITEQYGIKEIWNTSFVFKKFRNRLERNPSKCPVGL